MSVADNLFSYLRVYVDKQDWMAFRCDAPRDKCAHFREINGIAAAFQYLQKNYIPTALSFL